MSRVSNFSFGITIILAIVLGSALGIGVGYAVKSFFKPAAIIEKQPIAKIEPLLDQEFYSPFEDIIYVKSTDTGWEVGTEEYGILFVEMSYNQAISMASVLTWVGYQCDYYCKEEMVDKALSEHYQLMYHE